MKCRACGNQMRPGHLQACPGRTANGQPVLVSPAASLGLTFNDEPDPLEADANTIPPTVEPSFKPDIETIRKRAIRLIGDIEEHGPVLAREALERECGAWTGDVVAEALAIKRGTEPIKATTELSRQDRRDIAAKTQMRQPNPNRLEITRAPALTREGLQNDRAHEEVTSERSVKGIEQALRNREETIREIGGGSRLSSRSKTTKQLFEDIHTKVEDGNTGAIPDSDLRRALLLSSIEAHHEARDAKERLAALRNIARFTGLDERMRVRLANLRRSHAAFKKKKVETAKEKDSDTLLDELYEIGRTGEVDE